MTDRFWLDNHHDIESREQLFRFYIRHLKSMYPKSYQKSNLRALGLLEST